MDYLESIDKGAREGKSYNEIARKLYLTYPTKVFIDDEERQYEILNDISKHFSVPITSVHVAGSAKTGRSFHKNKDFKPKISDLDIAIIDSNLFHKYMEFVFTTSIRYTDKTKFRIVNGVSELEVYLRYLSKGIFRADLMPTSPKRAEWSNYFGTLSRKHNDLFKSINGVIYLSQVFFESKQRSSISNYLNGKAVL